jgi:hypothetical protein
MREDYSIRDVVKDALTGLATSTVIYLGMDYLLNSTNFPLYDKKPSDIFLCTIAGAGLAIFTNKQNKMTSKSLDSSVE